MSKLKHIPTIKGVAINNISCYNCNWNGIFSDCDFETEPDQFYGSDRKFPICPKCGGNLDY